MERKVFSVNITVYELHFSSVLWLTVQKFMATEVKGRIKYSLMLWLTVRNLTAGSDQFFVGKGLRHAAATACPKRLDFSSGRIISALRSG